MSASVYQHLGVVFHLIVFGVEFQMHHQGDGISLQGSDCNEMVLGNHVQCGAL